MNPNLPKSHLALARRLNQLQIPDIPVTRLAVKLILNNPCWTLIIVSNKRAIGVCRLPISKILPRRRRKKGHE